MADKDLVGAIKNYDTAAFKKLVDQYQSMVLNTCYGFVHNSDDAQDITQEVFIKIYDSIHKFRGDSKLSTWIYRIAVNKSLNYIRANKKRQLISNIESVNHISSDQLVVSPESDLEDESIESSERTQILFAAVNSLSKNQRIAFTLNKLDSISYNEVGEIMNISLPAVESLIHRAKLNLQKKLIKYYKKMI